MLQSTIKSLILSLALGSSLFAQNRVTIDNTFEPSFTVEPLVQRIEGRQGDVLQFQFRVSTQKPTAKIEVSLVGLKQNISGQITHADGAYDSDSIQLINPGLHTIAKGNVFSIDGILRIPNSDTKFFSFGVLVKDLGEQRDRGSRFDENGKELTQAGINFVTQYVLRVDVEVRGARGENIRELQIEQGAVSTFRGLPLVSALINNPTDSTFEFEVKAQLKRSPTDRSMEEMRLVMPIRQSLLTDERFVGRILPHSKIRMQEILYAPLINGEYEIDCEVLANSRKVISESFPVPINLNDFPAQQLMIKHVGGDVYMTPTQVELSQLRGGNRRVMLELQNNSDQTKTIYLACRDSAGIEMSGLKLQPNSLTLQPGRKRRVSLSLVNSESLRAGAMNDAVEYGELLVASRDSIQNTIATGSTPLAVMFSEIEAPEITLGEAVWWQGKDQPSFRCSVENAGLRHVVLDAELRIEAESSGSRFAIPAGFGRWLLPGESTALEFRLPGPLPPGNYLLTTELRTGQTPIIKKQMIRVSENGLNPNNVRENSISENTLTKSQQAESQQAQIQQSMPLNTDAVE